LAGGAGVPDAGEIASAFAFGAVGGCASRFAPLAGAFSFRLTAGAFSFGLTPGFDLAPACDFAPGAGFASGALLGLAFTLPVGLPAGFEWPFARGPGFVPAFGPGAPFACPFACPRGTVFVSRSAFQGFAGGPRFTGVTFVA
jgi:hypothetical protein